MFDVCCMTLLSVVAVLALYIKPGLGLIFKKNSHVKYQKMALHPSYKLWWDYHLALQVTCDQTHLGQQQMHNHDERDDENEDLKTTKPELHIIALLP
jgi:hypothetical protein